MGQYVLRISDLPLRDRPRERLLSQGAKSLSHAELLAILLNTGQGPGKLSALGLAQLLLKKLEAQGDPLAQLRQVEAGELLQIEGIGPAKAATVLAVIESPEQAAMALSADLMWEAQEHFAVLHLDIKHRLIGQQIVTRGTATETLTHPRETFRSAIKQGASRILVAHNHPSGSLDPSPEDLALTRQLLQAGQLLQIPVLDHLILGGGQFLSLRQHTNLWQEFPQPE